MKYLIFIVLICLQAASVRAATTTYDFANRTPNSNIFAYGGLLSSKIPSNKTSPSTQYSSDDYSRIQANDSFYRDSYTTSKNTYPSIRYVVELDESASSITQLSLFWNGFGRNSKNNQQDGVEIHIWNDASDNYELLVETTSSNYVDLTGNKTSGLTNYIDENNRVTIFIVSQGKTFNREDNWIRTDYFSLTVTADSVVVPAAVIANYQFDQCTYTGSGSEVIDQTGSYSGSISGVSSSNTTAIINRSLDLTATSTSDYVVLPRELINGLDDFSLSIWVNTTTSKAQQEIFQALGNDEFDDELEVYLINSTTVNVKIKDVDQPLSAGKSLTDGQWHQLVVTRDGSDVCLYVDGSQSACGNNISAGALSVQNSNSILIGQEQDSIGGNFDPNQSFEGLMDELIIYDGELTEAEVSTLYTRQLAGRNYDDSTRAPSSCSTIHHYEIVHDGNGLTCAAEPFTIKACTDSSCSSVSTESVSLDLQVTNSAVPPVTSTKQSVTFTGSGSFNFSHTTAEVLNLSIANATVNASNAVECSGFGSSCQMTFANAGFRFLYDTDINTTIATQTAGTTFPQSLKLQAVRDNSGVCEGIFTGNVNVSLSQQNITPDASYNAGLTFQTSGNDIAKHPSYTNNVSLNFGTNSIATIPTPRYLDVGQIRLHAQYSNADITLAGSSNDFWVKPAKFTMSARKTNTVTDIDGNSATNTTIHPAGAVFDFSVEAVNSLGARVQNYRQGDGQLQLKIDRVLPINTGTVDDNFTYAAGGELATAISSSFSDVALSSFSADSSNIGLSKYAGAKFAEVGILNADIQDRNYGGLGNVSGLISGDAITIGRFTPAYFKQTIKSVGNLDALQSAAATCSAVNWAYTGQQNSDSDGIIFYSLKPEVAITAYNNDDEITQNYTLGYSVVPADNVMKLNATKVDVITPTYDFNQLRRGETDPDVTDNLVALSAEINTGEFLASTTAGQRIYTFSENDHFTYTRDNSSFVAPFQAEIPFVIDQVTDNDGVQIGTDSSGDKYVSGFEISGVEVRFARMVIENAFGSETAVLRAPLGVQVFDGTSFIQANDESCLTPLITAKKAGVVYSGNLNLWDYRLVDLDNTDALDISDTAAAIENNFTAGEHYDLFFSAPLEQGGLELEYEVPAWLKFDWQNQDTNNNGPYTDNPTAILNFGLYRGNDRIISWREVNN